MPQHDANVVLNLVDLLYAAALDGEKWGAFLAAAAGAVGADHAFVCQLDFHTRSLEYVGLAQDSRDAVPVRRYGTLLQDDPRRAIFDAGPNKASHCRMGTVPGAPARLAHIPQLPCAPQHRILDGGLPAGARRLLARSRLHTTATHPRNPPCGQAPRPANRSFQCTWA
jgi:hypothetical protein